MIYLKSSILFLLSFLLSSFIRNSQPNNENLVLISKTKLSISEPSGLAFDSSNNTLLIVSDNNSKVYKTDLSGNILFQREINSEDLEGITILNDSTYAVISEREREIILIDSDLNPIKTIKTGIKGKKNSGFEGISFIPADNILIIANEKRPTEIYNFSLVGEILSQHKIKFANDISGLFYDSIKNNIWILSEASTSIFKCDMNFNILKTYKIPDDQIEGITINDSDLYLVSDKSEILYHYKINN